ncbi:MAG TPA: glycosyltransferase family 4 protein [Baekduia sp.]|nr:glycosyltransferase family 4 protein [Baekduia sp.]
MGSEPGARHVVIALENEPYPYDRRVRQEAEALVAAGHAVTVCGPTGFGHDAAEEVLDGVRVLRFPAPPAGRGPGAYLREYAVALTRLWRLLRRVGAERAVDAVIVCAPPDLMVLPALGLRRRGAALVVDHHDLSPELLEEKFGRRPLLDAAVRATERWALRRADAVLAMNDTGVDVARRRAGVAAERVFVVRNGPDPRRIHPVAARPELRRGKDRLVVWAGAMSSDDGLGELLDVAEELTRRRGRRDVGFTLLGAGPGRDALLAQAHRRGLADVVHLPGLADDALLRDHLATADVCIGVDRPSPMNDAATMTKVVEYLAMGRPVVQYPLRETARVCGDATVYAQPGDTADFARCIEELLDDPERATRLAAAAQERAVPALLWPQQVPVLLEAVEAACRTRAGRAG